MQKTIQSERYMRVRDMLSTYYGSEMDEAVLFNRRSWKAMWAALEKWMLC